MQHTVRIEFDQLRPVVDWMMLGHHRFEVIPVKSLERNPPCLILGFDIGVESLAIETDLQDFLQLEPERARWIQRAKDTWHTGSDSDNDIEISDDASVYESKAGAFVSAQLWVYRPDEDDDEDDDEELPDLLDACGSLPASPIVKDTFRELLEEVRDDADDTGCEGVHTVDSHIIAKIEKALSRL